jgi:MFS family permease
VSDAQRTERGGAAIWLLALGQTLTYAGCLYAFPALLPELEEGTGWGKATLALGPTLGFLIMAGLTVLTGRLVDRGLGGEMLVWGPVLVALGVLGLGLAPSPAVWLLAWAVIGVGQAGCLYETLFAFLTRRLGTGARAAITRVTLVAGFAGTLAFPLGHWAGERLGGQGGMLVFAGVVLLAVPCNLWAVRSLRRRERAEVEHRPAPPGTLQLRVDLVEPRDPGDLRAGAFCRPGGGGGYGGDCGGLYRAGPGGGATAFLHG